MTVIDFEGVLPDPLDQDLDKLKKETPYGLLHTLMLAIRKKYPNKLDARITESYSAGSDNEPPLLSLTLNLRAAIGRGYVYPLLELTQGSTLSFPATLTLNEETPAVLGTYNNYEELGHALSGIFSRPFVQKLMNTLLAQVELSQQSQSNDGSLGIYVG